MPRREYDTLVLSGGAIKAVAFVGCVRYLEHTRMLGHVRTLVGSSAGALLAFMLALGMSTDEMETWVIDRLRSAGVNRIDCPLDRLSGNSSDSDVDPFARIVDDVFDVYKNMGIDGGARLDAFLRDILESRTAVRDITFRDLAKRSGRHLIVCASNLTHTRPEYFSVDTWPDLSVVTALRASTCIPILFAPVVIGHMMFVDGGLFENLPAGALSSSASANRQQQSAVPPAASEPWVLALNVSWIPRRSLPTNILDYTWYLITALLHRANNVCDDEAIAATGPCSVSALEIGKRLGWTVVDIDVGGTCSSEQDRDASNDVRVSSSSCEEEEEATEEEEEEETGEEEEEEEQEDDASNDDENREKGQVSLSSASSFSSSTTAASRQHNNNNTIASSSFLGMLCVDSSSVEFCVDVGLLRRFMDEGYTAMQESGCFDPRELVPVTRLCPPVPLPAGDSDEKT